MKLSTKARYTTRILVDLAFHSDGPVPLGQITARQQVSHSYLNHLIAPLVNAGIIGSARGYGGGIWLARAPEQIRLGEVIRLLEGNVLVADCVRTPELCQRAENCAARSVWAKVEQAIFNILDSVTIRDLVTEQETSLSCYK